MRSLEALLRAGVEEGLYTGAASAWGSFRGLETVAVGTLTDGLSADVSARTHFDLASLTKVLCTAAVCFTLVKDGSLALDDPVSDHLPSFPLGSRSVASLLTHTSGLPPYLSGWNGSETPADIWRRLEQIFAMETCPEATYSCLGFIWLGRLIERVSGLSLAEAFDTRVAKPLELTAAFRTVEKLSPDCPATALVEGWRAPRLGCAPGAALQGVVHDPLAFLLGGVSGNAGLFGSVLDVARFAQAVLQGRPPLDGYAEWGRVKDGGRGLGWDVKSPTGSSAGNRASSGSFGHTGFTGTSLWIDPQAEVFVVLLTNASLKAPPIERFRAFRVQVYDQAVGEIC